MFTLPSALHALVLANRRELFTALFDASARSLQELARDPRRLGVELGITSVLHTWGQRLNFHPHVHCVVTGGGLSVEGERWIAARPGYLLPVRALARLFRGKFLARLEELRRAGELQLPGKLAALRDDSVWAMRRHQLYSGEWVVCSKPPFGGPEQVFAYLGRYTHRVAISNHRIVEVADGSVTFAYRDYADGNRQKQSTVPGVEFLRRFLLHVLPRRFVRLRHYGLHASSCVGTKLVTARELLGGEPPVAVTAVEEAVGSSESGSPASTGTPPTSAPATESWAEALRRTTGFDALACPRCGAGRLVRREILVGMETARATARSGAA